MSFAMRHRLHEDRAAPVLYPFMSFPVSRGKRPVPVRLLLLIMFASFCLGTGVGAQDIRFFQIGTGPSGESRFAFGGLIANAISNPPGSRDCDKGGSCGVPGLVAVAKATGGAMGNVEGVAAGRLDAALVQADVASWAYRGTGAYKGRPPMANLRTIAMLYPESLHLVARKDARIHSVKDLKGKRVSLGDRDTGELARGRLVLAAWGLGEKQVRLNFLRPAAAADAMAAGQLDAMLVLDGAPVPIVAELARRVPIVLVPLAGPEAERLRAAHPLYGVSAIPAGTYPGVEAEVRTLEVGVALLTSAERSETLIRGVTRALWHPSTRRLLAEGHPRGGLLGLSAFGPEGMGIPPHGGASAYYSSAGSVQ